MEIQLHHQNNHTGTIFLLIVKSSVYIEIRIADFKKRLVSSNYNFAKKNPILMYTTNWIYMKILKGGRGYLEHIEHKNYIIH